MESIGRYRIGTIAGSLSFLLLFGACASLREATTDFARKMGKTPAIQPPPSEPAMQPGVRLALQSVQGLIRFPHGVTSVYGTDSKRIETDLFRTREAILRALALLPEDRRIVIVGHSDPVGGPHAALHYGTARARSVRNYLVRRGVPRGRLTTMSAGASELQNKKDIRAPENHRITFSVR